MHGHPVLLAETFIDPSRFVGTCYRAANWIALGHTRGFAKPNRFLANGRGVDATPSGPVRVPHPLAKNPLQWALFFLFSTDLRGDWLRYRGIALDMKRPPFKELVLNNVFFDTCVYHQPGIDLLLKVVPAENILFASEMVGAVRGIDPKTGFHFDDTKRYVDNINWVSKDNKEKIFSGNVSKVFPRFAKRAKK